jgi:hypothetical protein
VAGVADRIRAKGGMPPASPVQLVTSTMQPKAKRTLRDVLSSGTVEWSQDFERVKNLPRRTYTPEEIEKIRVEMTMRLRKPGGTQELRPNQALALNEMEKYDGFIGNLACGAGKEILGIVGPLVLKNCRKAVLLLPPELRAQFFNRDWEFYGQHWETPNLVGGRWFKPGRPALHVVAYSELSSTKNSDVLTEINPDAIFANECHKMKNRKAARTFRFMGHYSDKPSTRFVGYTGTLTSSSPRELGHLAVLALGEGAPVPVVERELEAWSLAVMPEQGRYYSPGVLQQLCEPGEAVRSGFRRRLIETPGVISTAESAVGVSLYVRERTAPKMPPCISKALRDLRRPASDGGWVRPDGEVLVTAMEVVACARMLSEGFHYFWRFTKGSDAEVMLWRQRRAAWHKEVRAKLESPVKYLESPKLCELAAMRYYEGGCRKCARGPTEEHEPGCPVAWKTPLWKSRTLLDWLAVKNTVAYVQDADWLSDYLLKDIAEWAAEKPGIVWVEHAEVGHQLAKLTGLTYYGEGDEAHEAMVSVDGSVSIICSVKAQSTGKNLQAFSRNLVVTFPSSGEVAEQMLARTHREGQAADEVTVELYLHTMELRRSFDVARDRAKYATEVLGSHQRLFFATYVGL